ncbi:MAG: hypothetical protein AAGI66_08705 [Cyanobacteria bacterium P01_H01_bin.74]
MTTKPYQSVQLMIAGPCSAEGDEQITFSIEQAAKRQVDFVRISLWKPRTKPGFDGLKEDGIDLLIKSIKMGVNPATEVLTPEHASAVIDRVLPHMSESQRLMIWIGARNQNHLAQQAIAKLAAQDHRISLMLKNQPWPSQSHWEGLAAHALEGGIAPENLILCHRGFAPSKHDPNPMGCRNLADSEMAMAVKAATGVKMIMDISHIAGDVKNIEPVTLAHMVYNYDGLIIEVHPNPRFAWTDAKQQITWEKLDDVMQKLDLAVDELRKTSSYPLEKVAT